MKAILHYFIFLCVYWFNKCLHSYFHFLIGSPQLQCVWWCSAIPLTQNHSAKQSLLTGIISFIVSVREDRAVLLIFSTAGSKVHLKFWWNFHVCLPKTETFREDRKSIIEINVVLDRQMDTFSCFWVFSPL